MKQREVHHDGGLATQASCDAAAQAELQREHGGMVLSATINQYAYASLRPRRDGRLVLASLDYDVVARYDHLSKLRFDGKLDLLKAVVRAMKVRRGLDLWAHSDAPPASSSSTS